MAAASEGRSRREIGIGGHGGSAEYCSESRGPPYGGVSAAGRERARWGAQSLSVVARIWIAVPLMARAPIMTESCRQASMADRLRCQALRDAEPCPAAPKGHLSVRRDSGAHGKDRMGRLVDGKWDHAARPDPRRRTLSRPETQFRNWVTVDGAPGPTGEGGFKAEPGRYHLYVSLACPWAHRTLIFRKLKKLTEAIGVSVVEPHMLLGRLGVQRDLAGPSLRIDRRLYEIYLMADPDLYRPGRACRSCGTSSARRSSPTSRPTSSAC